MSAGLLGKLSTELWATILEGLPWEARLQLSSTNSYWRTYFAPSLFHTIRFSNLVEDEEAIAGVFSRCGRYASVIHFEWHLKRDARQVLHGRRETYDPSKPRCPDTKLTDIAAKLLRGEACPGARSIVVTPLYVERMGPYDRTKGMWVPSDGGDTDDEDENDEVQEKEAKYPWIAMMARTWACLAVNPAIRSLDVLPLPPTWTSTWRTQEWRDFLGRLEGLTLDLWGPDDGRRYADEDYCCFLTSLDAAFLIYARNLRRLSISADICHPYGGDTPSGPNRPMALWSVNMPMLETLTLENCIMDEAVLGFIKSHSKCLQRIQLIDCWSVQCNDHTRHDNITWAELFDAMAQRPLVLWELVITNDEDLLDRADRLGLGNEAALVRSTLARYSSRKLFAFGDDSLEGPVNGNTATITQRFLSGEDQVAYDRLMRIVESNRWERAARILNHADSEGREQRDAR